MASISTSTGAVTPGSSSVGGRSVAGAAGLSGAGGGACGTLALAALSAFGSLVDEVVLAAAVSDLVFMFSVSSCDRVLGSPLGIHRPEEPQPRPRIGMGSHICQSRVTLGAGCRMPDRRAPAPRARRSGDVTRNAFESRRVCWTVP
jgi:hypothetical protein